MTIDYARMAKAWPKQKAALTRAVRAGNPDRVADVCRAAVVEWDAIGAWPDDWSRFQRALDDAYSAAGRGYFGPRLEDL